MNTHDRRYRLPLAGFLLAVQLAPGAYASAYGSPKATVVQVRLTEWSVTLTPDVIPPGTVVFQVANSGTIPHAFEVEGEGIEKSTPQIQPGQSAHLTLALGGARYAAYCPVGKGSHRMLGMMSHLTVGQPKRTAGKPPRMIENKEHDEAYGEADHAEMHGHDEHGESSGAGPRMTSVV